MMEMLNSAEYICRVRKIGGNIPFTIDLGKTYAYLGDGNVLDGDFEGVKNICRCYA